MYFAVKFSVRTAGCYAVKAMARACERKRMQFGISKTNSVWSTRRGQSGENSKHRKPFSVTAYDDTKSKIKILIH